MLQHSSDSLIAFSTKTAISHTHDVQPDASLRLTRVLMWVVCLLCAWFIGLFLFLAISHLFFPFEIDWYEGVVLDHSVRLLQGKPIYAAPTIDFVACLYQPLYYYLTAGMMKIIGIGYEAGRWVSFLCTGISCGVIFYTIRRELSSVKGALLQSIIGVALFLAAYEVTGFTYDIARIDSLLLALLLTSVAVSLYGGERWSAIGAALLLTLAFFTKQQIAFYIPVFALWFFVRRRSSGVLFLLVLALGIAAGILYLNNVNGAWYWYYVFDIPKMKSQAFGWLRLPLIFPMYVCTYWGIASLLILVALWRWKGSKTISSLFKTHLGFLSLMWLMSIVQVAMHLGDQMSYKNVVLPLAATMALMFALLPQLVLEGVEREEIRAHPTSYTPIFFAAAIMQLLAMLYNPFKEPLIVIHEADRRAGETFTKELASINGEVYMPSHGFLSTIAGKETHAFSQTMLDVQIMNDSTSSNLNASLNAALAHHRFGAIIVDNSDLVHPDSIAGYTFSRLINTSDHPFASRIGSSLSIPRYLYVPKSNSSSVQE